LSPLSLVAHVPVVRSLLIQSAPRAPCASQPDAHSYPLCSCRLTFVLHRSRYPVSKVQSGTGCKHTHTESKAPRHRTGQPRAAHGSLKTKHACRCRHRATVPLAP
jgi:hypothetical protein